MNKASLSNVKGLLTAVMIFFTISPAFSADPNDFYGTLSFKGEPGAAKVGKLQMRLQGSEIHYKLEVHNIRDVTMAHLHLGHIGDLSTPVVWLYPASPPARLIPGEFNGVLAEGTITAKDLIGPLRGKPLDALIKEMRSGNIFVNIHNIHTEQSAAGQICGVVECPVPQ